MSAHQDITAQEPPPLRQSRLAQWEHSDSMWVERPLMIVSHAQMEVQTPEKAQEHAFCVEEEQATVKTDQLALALVHSELGKTAPTAVSVRRATLTQPSQRRIRHQPQTWTVSQILLQFAHLDSSLMSSMSASQSLPARES